MFWFLVGSLTGLYLQNKYDLWSYVETAYEFIKSKVTAKK